MGRASDRVRRLCAASAGVGIATVMILFLFSAAGAASPRGVSAGRAVTASVPTLGIASRAGVGIGFGQVTPHAIGYGGDPTGFVGNVKWHSWGGARAVGHGTADWVWPGWCVACGTAGHPATVMLPATVVAFGRTSCQGHNAYSRVEWYFPSRGQSFNRWLSAVNLCTGSISSPPFRWLRCGHVLLRSRGAVIAVADNIMVYDISCTPARRFVGRSGAARYAGQNARFTVYGWWCGSELLSDLGGPQSFTCTRRDFTTVTFKIRPAHG